MPVGVSISDVVNMEGENKRWLAAGKKQESGGSGKCLTVCLFPFLLSFNCHHHFMILSLHKQKFVKFNISKVKT